MGLFCSVLSLDLCAQQPFSFMPEGRARKMLAKSRPKVDSQIVALLSLQQILRVQHFDSSLLLVNRALDLIEAHDKSYYAATANRSKGDALFFKGNYQQAILGYGAVLAGEIKAEDRIQAVYAALGIGKCYLFLGRMDSAKLAYEQAEHYLGPESLPQHWATYYSAWTEYYLQMGDLDMADRMADSLSARAIQSGWPKKLAQALDHQATINIYRNEYPTAIAQIRRASHIYDSLTINSLRISAYTNLGLLYGEVRKNDSAMAYLLRALEVAEELQDSSTMVLVRGQIAALYARNGESETSLRYLETALQDVEQLDHIYLTQWFVPHAELMIEQNDEPGYRKLMQILEAQDFSGLQADNLAIMAIKVLGEVTFERRYAAAIPKLTHIIQARDQIGVAIHPAGPQLWLVQCYLGLSQPEKALKELAQVRMLVETQPSLDMQTKVELYSMQAHHQLGHVKAAREAQLAYEQLQRKASDMRHAVALQEAETRYRTNQIAAERDLQTREATLANQKAQQTLRLAAAIGIGLLAAASLAFSLYRSRERQKRLIAEITQQRDRNETLLRELNHRVKNNLQQISGLLMLQGRQAPHQETKEALKVSQQRMDTMSLLHTLLYQGEDVSEINLRDYLYTLTHNLLNDYGFPTARIELELSLADLSVDVDQGIPLGLIANEWLTNALKYALPHAPYLRVALRLLDAQTAELIVADRGPGLPPGFDPMAASSYGLKLVQTMSEQMYAEVSVEREGGTQWRLWFGLG